MKRSFYIRIRSFIFILLQNQISNTLFRTVVISILLAVTPVLAILNERTVEDPIDLSVRSMINDDTLIFAREIEQPPELARRIMGLVSSLILRSFTFLISIFQLALIINDIHRPQ